MFQIDYTTKNTILTVKNSTRTVFAEFHLAKGGSLQKLKLKNTEIIKDLNPLAYENTYASSILFPFANRIKDGKYAFEGTEFQFPINVAEENNALHGLVFNKKFELVNSETNEKNAKIVLAYNETNESLGFPYTYKLQLVYTLSESNMELAMKVENTSPNSFPFTAGWHPYFYTSNLHNSSLRFSATKQMILDDRNITIDTKTVDTSKGIAIKNNSFDDCWELGNDEVIFSTPDYNLKFNATGTNNFLQVYTPPKKNTIAIEQTTGVSDSFNNKIGVSVLKPNETYTIKWSLHLDNTNNE